MIRIDCGRVKEMALRYATTELQRHHIQTTRYYRSEKNPYSPPMIPYFPDRQEPEFPIVFFAKSVGLKPRAVNERFLALTIRDPRRSFLTVGEWNALWDAKQKNLAFRRRKSMLKRIT